MAKANSKSKSKPRRMKRTKPKPEHNKNGRGAPFGKRIYRTDVLAEQFADEYLKNGMNGTQACIAIGYKPNIAQHTAVYYLKDPRVRLRLDYLRRKAKRKRELTVERVLDELYKIGFSDMRDFVYYDEDGNIHLHPDGIDDPDLSPAISELSMSSSGSGKTLVRKGRIRLHDKAKALIDLGKHLGMWPGRSRHAFGDDDDDSNSGPIEIHVKGGLPTKVIRELK